jgi:hypothetical protein
MGEVHPKKSSVRRIGYLSVIESLKVEVLKYIENYFCMKHWGFRRNMMPGSKRSKIVYLNPDRIGIDFFYQGEMMVNFAPVPNLLWLMFADLSLL